LDVGLLKRRRPWLGWRTSKPTSHAVPDSRESGARRARDFTSWIPLQRSSFMGQKRCSTSTPSLARGSPDRVSRAPSMTRSARGVRRSRDETCDGSVLVDLDDDDVGAGPRAMSIGSSTGCLTGVSGRLATGSRVAVGLQRSPCGLDIGTSADTGRVRGLRRLSTDLWEVQCLQVQGHFLAWRDRSAVVAVRWREGS
jgi:hypothetical protein